MEWKRAFHLGLETGFQWDQRRIIFVAAVVVERARRQALSLNQQVSAWTPETRR
jgi:hypothetical protein